MPRIRYKDYKPKPIGQRLIEQCDEILIDYANRGYDLTLRQLYYQLVSRDWLPDAWAHPDTGVKNRLESYNKLKTLVGNAREAGMLDWDHIKDRTREVRKYRHYCNPKQFIRRFRVQFLMDMWRNQKKRVEVWYEKAALMQIIEQAADPYDVPTFACRGYGSLSSLWEAGKRFAMHGNAWTSDYQQEVVILHLGDHDPSGMHMTDDIADRVAMFTNGHEDGPTETEFTVKRIALNMDQVEEYNPPPDPAKMTDSRAPAYVEEYGEYSWELDALDPDVLTELVQRHIREELDVRTYAADRAQEETYQSQLAEVADNWDQVIGYLVEEGIITEDEEE